jgi:CDP-4-dehydro-6-deoxyglucose reductase, E1
MTKPRYDYPTAFSLWEDEEHAAIDRVIRSSQHTMADEVRAFEAEFAAWHGVSHGIMVNSGSSANLILVTALVEMGLAERGSCDVAVPAIAWSTTYAPLVQNALELHLVDVDATWNADWKSHESLHNIDLKYVGLLVSVPILGNPTELPTIKSGQVIIEDNCESLGAVSPSGRKMGTGVRASTFSFFHSHQISAIEGGMILTDDGELAKMCRVLRAHGWTRDVEPPLSFDTEYNFVRHGYNVRPLEICAAVAREQLKKLPRFIAARRQNQEYFLDKITSLNATWPCIWPQKIQGQTSPFGLSFCVESAEVRQKLVLALRAHSIDCRLPTGGSFTLHPYGWLYREQEAPCANTVHRTGLFLGNAPYFIKDKIDLAVEIIEDVVSKAGA